MGHTGDEFVLGLGFLGTFVGREFKANDSQGNVAKACKASDSQGNVAKACSGVAYPSEVQSQSHHSLFLVGGIE